MNASACSIFSAPKCCHITPTLQEIHWLPVRMHIDFKILLITFKILQGLAPKNLQDLASVLPRSCYSLRRNNNRVLLSRPQVKTTKTMDDCSFMVAAPMR